MGIKRFCKVCGKPADIYIPYARIALCREHFVEFYERRIVKTLKDAKFRGGRVLVAVSGGKDSVALISSLSAKASELGIQLEGIHIDLGIPKYSEECLKVVKHLSDIINVKIHIIRAKDEIGFTVPDAIKASKRPACSICGTIKRWLINKFAYENGFDYIATGHNIDDAAAFYLKALLSYTIEDIIKGQHVLTPPVPELKLVGRLRPQIFLREADNLAYVVFRNLPFTDLPCPLAKGAKIFKYKRVWPELLKLNPGGQINFVKALNELASYAPKEVKLIPCKVCGYPTSSSDGVCSLCRIRIRLGKIPPPEQ